MTYFLKVLAAILLVAPVALIAGTPIFTWITLKNYYRAAQDCRKGRLPAAMNEKTAPPEPAFRSYFLKRARLDLYDVIREGYVRSYHSAESFERWVERKFDSIIYTIVYLGSAVTISAFFIGMVIPYAIVIPIHHVVVYSACALSYVAAPYFRFAEYVARRYRSVTYTCPKCYRRIGLLYYYCNQCGAKHRKLVPGSYGVIRRRCQCGNKLPAFDLVGRSKLPKECPHCGYHIMGDDARTSHIALIGGASTGKTSYLVAALWAYIEHIESAGMEAKFPYPEDLKKYIEWTAKFSRGIPPEKTQEKAPTALVLQITEIGGNKHNVYIYDADGDLYQTKEGIATSGFLRLAQGVIFVIDPLSLPKVSYWIDRVVVKAARPSGEDADDMLSCLTEFIETEGTDAYWRKVPVFVVVNKADVIGKTGMSGPEAREWLREKGLADFDFGLQQHFDDTPYYMVSALGRNADRKSSFRPVNVLGPLVDLLGKSRIHTDQTRLKSRLLSQRVATALGFSASTMALALSVFLVGVLASGVINIIGSLPPAPPPPAPIVVATTGAPPTPPSPVSRTTTATPATPPPAPPSSPSRPQISPQPPADLPAPIFEDNFNDSRSGWTISSDETGDWAYESGEYSLTVKKTNWMIWAKNKSIADLSDFSAQVDIRKLSRGPGEAAGLVFREASKDGKNNLYRFQIRSDNGTYSIDKLIQGSWTKLVNWAPSPYIKRDADTNQLRVDAKGTLIEVYANGHKLNVVNDTSLVSGGVGLTACSPATLASGHFHFDNFELYRISAASPTMPPTSTPTPTPTSRPTPTPTPTPTPIPASKPAPDRSSTTETNDLTDFLGTWGEKWADISISQSITISQVNGSPKVSMKGNWLVWDEKFENGVLSFRKRGGDSNWEFLYTIEKIQTGKMKLTVFRVHDQRTFGGELYR